MDVSHSGLAKWLDFWVFNRQKRVKMKAVNPFLGRRCGTSTRSSKLPMYPPTVAIPLGTQKGTEGKPEETRFQSTIGLIS